MRPKFPTPTHALMRLGYGWNESTNLACAIADVANHSDITVKIISTEKREVGVHTKWDRVLWGGDDLAQHTTAIWFEPRLHEISRLKKHGVRNILVPRVPGQVEEMRAAADYCSDIVVGDSDYLQYFISTGKARPIPACCSVVEPHISPRANPNECVWIIDSRTLRKFGYGVMRALQLVLDFNKQLNVTLIFQGTCDAATSHRLKELLRNHPTRLRFIRRCSRQNRQTVYRECGWGVVLCCGDTGVTYLLEGLYAGLYMAGLNYGGAREIFQSFVGYALPCQVDDNQFGIPQAVIDHAQLVDSLQCCYEALHENQFDQLTLSPVKQRLVQRKLCFESGWHELWNLN